LPQQKAITENGINATDIPVLRIAMNLRHYGELLMARKESVSTLCKSTGRTAFGVWSIRDATAKASAENVGIIAVMTPLSAFTSSATRRTTYLQGPYWMTGPASSCRAALR
jgi:hypothetical protein